MVPASSAQSESSREGSHISRGTARMPRNDVPRVILSLDLDAFYASALLQLPEYAHLSDRPVGVIQKHLVVTTNYVARARGVAKMSPVFRAKAKCPEIALIDGSDLAPFRVAARKVRLAVAAQLPDGTPIEYLDLDEMFVDVSAVVAEWMRRPGVREAEVREDWAGTATDAAPRRPWKYCGHVLAASTDATDEEMDVAKHGPSGTKSIRSLQLGSQLASELLAGVRKSTGFAMCAGVANSKMGAKLAAGMHKPDDQTTILSSVAVAEYLEQKVPVKIPGFGRGYAMRLSAWADSEEAIFRPRPKVDTVAGLLDTFSSPLMKRELARILGVSQERAVWESV